MAKKPDPFMIDEENPEWTVKETAEAGSNMHAASAQVRPLRGKKS